MNVEPRKIVTLDGATVTLTANEVKVLISELKWLHMMITKVDLYANSNSTIKLQHMLEEKCTL